MPERVRKGKRNEGRPVTVQAEITAVAAEGKAIARIDDKVVFVPYGAPGDYAELLLMKSRKSYAEARILRLIKPSPLRTEPFCSHFGLCGGCKWQHLPYEAQLEFKQQQVFDQITRLGNIAPDSFEMQDILASEKTRFYRNKLEFTFASRRWLTQEEISSGVTYEHQDGLGFHMPGMYDRVLDIDSCYLQESPSNEIRNWLRDYARKQNLEFFDLRKGKGFLRNLVIRSNPDGEVMVIVVFGEENPKLAFALLKALLDAFPGLTSLLYAVNGGSNPTLTSEQVILYHGSGWLTERLKGLEFKIGPVSFFQTNSYQAAALYQSVLDFAQLEGHELVYDLYTGTGTIALFLARHARFVIGIEYVEEAVAHARTNADINSIGNVSFFSGDMARVLTDVFFQNHGFPGVIVTDPPRAGMHPRVVEQIMLSGADKIVYVSCNPATQARDIALMQPKYSLVKLRPVDMFPHTHHVESIALLVRK